METMMIRCVKNYGPCYGVSYHYTYNQACMQLVHVSLLKKLEKLVLIEYVERNIFILSMFLYTHYTIYVICVISIMLESNII